MKFIPVRVGKWLYQDIQKIYIFSWVILTSFSGGNVIQCVLVFFSSSKRKLVQCPYTEILDALLSRKTGLNTFRNFNNEACDWFYIQVIFYNVDRIKTQNITARMFVKIY